jgi:peroxiredoxin
LPVTPSTRILPYVPAWILTLALVLVGTLAACGESNEPHDSGNESTSVSIDPVSTATAGQSAPAAVVRSERLLPNFTGTTVAGKRLKISSLIGQRFLIHSFNPETPVGDETAKAVSAIAKLREKNNFEVIGIGTGSSWDKIVAFKAKHGIDYPILDDSSAAIAQRLGLRSPSLLALVDAEGYVIFNLQHYKTDAPHPEKGLEAKLRGALRLPAEEKENEPLLGNRPLAPVFHGNIKDGDEIFDLASHRGEAVIVIFFLHTCPHCHHALELIRRVIQDLPADKRPFLIGVEISSRGPDAVRRALDQHDINFFPYIFDRDDTIKELYGVFGGVPDTFFIDRSGRIAHHVMKWGKDREPLIRMQLAKLAGAPVPMMLRKQGFSGSEACGTCHESQHETWLFTKHAHAFDTLVKHGESTNPECVSCHVVGFGEPGGFTHTSDTPQLEDVGCEVCHGRGGPHISGKPAGGQDYEEVCGSCHNPEHSLGFDYATFLPQISHAANAHVTNLSLEERQVLLAKLGTSRNPLPTLGSYVGSEACQSCHTSEHASWSEDPHSRALESLVGAGEAGNAECLQCHTTGFGRSGGFPEDGSAKSHPDLARVGCESCHGRGSEHIKEEATKIGSIVSLGDKCDSCVILQICGSCHDDANHPGFEFEVQDKIDLQRHGSIEPGTGKPKDPNTPFDVSQLDSVDTSEPDRSGH